VTRRFDARAAIDGDLTAQQGMPELAGAGEPAVHRDGRGLAAPHKSMRQTVATLSAS
jgi:hypothetical protein